MNLHRQAAVGSGESDFVICLCEFLCLCYCSSPGFLPPSRDLPEETLHMQTTTKDTLGDGILSKLVAPDFSLRLE